MFTENPGRETVSCLVNWKESTMAGASGAAVRHEARVNYKARQGPDHVERAL